MEIQHLQAIVLTLVLTGMIIGIGVIVLDKFGIATRTSTDISNESITISSGAGTAAHSNLTAVTSFGNTTHFTNSTQPIGTWVNWTAAGAVKVNGDYWPDSTYYIYYTYGESSQTTRVTGAVNSAIGTLPTTWLPLIVTVLALSIILMLVIRSFVVNRR